MSLYKNRIVVKVGTSTLTNEAGRSDLRSFGRMACVLSDIDGLYDRDPRLYPEAKLISTVESVDEKMYSYAGGAGSRRGTGGMKTKLRAASLAARNGADVVITNRKRPDAIYDIIEGKGAGTLFRGYPAKGMM